jgi:thioredoxin-related protein
LYLFGKLRFPHDSPFEKLSVTRFLFAFPFAVLAIYMIPGLWGAPLKIISGFPPPMFYAESAGTFGGGHESGSGSGHVTAHYSDYDEALAAAIEADKPLLIDYTGWACVNCRKMEETIWTVPKVAEILNNDVILVSLYVDERTKLPAEEQRVESYAGKDFKIKTIGNKWSFQQVSKYHTNAQPFYVMVDNQGKQLGGLSASYDSDPAVFVSFLKSGVAAYKKK